MLRYLFFVLALLSSRAQSFVISTAWQWCADERLSEPEITWIEPRKHRTNDIATNGSIIVPLYPLPATFLPTSGVNHTLNNVEPKNVAMALDVMNSTEKRFCVVLRLIDSGRVATVGTMMKLLDMEIHRLEDESISRIVVNCCAEKIVDIISIENGEEVENPLNKLMKAPTYLRARVAPRIPKEIYNSAAGTLKETILQLIKDYNEVRSMYNGGVGTNDLPPFARPKLIEAMPPWSTNDFVDEPSFWKSANSWQQLCNTVREGRQISLSADRNEIMVKEATKKGGPLQLPIHLEDLSPQTQRQIQLMEVEQQKNFVSCGLDPCLDFQSLIMADHSERIILLSTMVARERDRLQHELATRTLQPPEDDPEESTLGKGAWFDDDRW